MVRRVDFLHLFWRRYDSTESCRCPIFPSRRHTIAKPSQFLRSRCRPGIATYTTGC